MAGPSPWRSPRLLAAGLLILSALIVAGQIVPMLVALRRAGWVTGPAT